MRLTTWNVNGIRNPFSYQPWNQARSFPAMFDILGSDIVVMQELKIQRKDLRDDMVLLDGWDCYFSLPKHKKGYSGVGIYTRNATCAPVKAEEGLLGVLPSPNGTPYCQLPEDQSIGGYPSELQVAELGVDPMVLDAEGRCVMVEFPAFVLLGVYSPANSNGLRDDFRYGFICALDCRIRNLSKAGKRVVLVGDLNVSRDERDTASALEDMRKAGITHEEYISTPNRRIFNQLLVDGEVVGERDDGRESGLLWDTCRAFHPQRERMYTHWEQKINARPGNFGSRIDFVLVCEEMQTWVKDANIQEGLVGSDHCPVYADFHDDVMCAGETVKLADAMNPAGVFSRGFRAREWRLSDVPVFSAKRLPEFERRRSIKSMFSTPSLIKQSSTQVAQGVFDAERSFIPSPPQRESEEPHTTVPLSQEIASTAPTAHDNQSSSGVKRKASMATKLKSSKRQKLDGAAPSLKGQQSLKGFFQSGRAEVDTTASTQSSTAIEPDAAGVLTTPETSPIKSTDGGINASATPAYDPTTHLPDLDSNLPPSSQSSTTSPSRVSAKLAAVERTQRSWSTLFSRPVAPMCEGHDEPCKSMLTKKKGSNQGRSFWMCARPLGPSGNKEKGTQWRCPTFIWCSDWQNGKGEAKDGGNG
ncbi:hypothetical protein BAUCODRAFT_32166 [Baudoinia panamericana UAMH 10762]|uniref:DNA-(apurinic or apyrimidinic site) endonuclease 2 n=1 Tax=Baudoinia panamericana (strain UAMH 10762) TaxID=717646 RepID=M2NGN7_BAUPA|nr:uncharacterized protein BAUCODRAFT_32166 [Baudoinia panamericana UAMH 10762]EMC98165.1 hypothetical protein BAUCODRAFT_32166 [Baudoinia panamericana UAMH 10762]